MTSRHSVTKIVRNVVDNSSIKGGLLRCWAKLQVEHSSSNVKVKWSVKCMILKIMYLKYTLPRLAKLCTWYACFLHNIHILFIFPSVKVYQVLFNSATSCKMPAERREKKSVLIIHFLFGCNHTHIIQEQIKLRWFIMISSVCHCCHSSSIHIYKTKINGSFWQIKDLSFWRSTRANSNKCEGVIYKDFILPSSDTLIHNKMK